MNSKPSCTFREQRSQKLSAVIFLTSDSRKQRVRGHSSLQGNVLHFSRGSCRYTQPQQAVYMPPMAGFISFSLFSGSGSLMESGLQHGIWQGRLLPLQACRLSCSRQKKYNFMHHRIAKKLRSFPPDTLHGCLLLWPDLTATSGWPENNYSQMASCKR